jgi:hypothetical protein
MTRSTLPPNAPNVEVPESTVRELHALYHEAAGAEPSLTLDRSILDAARAELRIDRIAKRRTTWWKGWMTVTSTLAVVVVGLSVAWRVMDEQERHLREEMSAAEGMRERDSKTVGRVAPAAAPTEAKSALNAQAPVVAKSRRVESTALKDAPVGVPEPAAQPAPAAPVPVAPAAMAPGLAEEAAKKSQRSEPDQLRERRDAGAAASGDARALGKLEAERPKASASGPAAADSVAQPALDAATPEVWLKQIRELRAAGRSAEAAQSLARFRARYPDFVLPDDLLHLK